MTATQQVGTIGHLAQLVEKQQEQGKSIVRTLRLLGLLVTNGTVDARTEQSSTPKNGRPTKRTGAGYTKSELPGKEATPATQDAGHRSSPLAQALIQLAKPRRVQKKTKEEAKRNRPWRNIPEYHARQREIETQASKGDERRRAGLQTTSHQTTTIQSPIYLAVKEPTNNNYSVQGGA